MSKSITVSIVVNAPIAKVWECWTMPDHIKNWAFASDEWGVGVVSNDVRVGGHFSTIMRANDGSASFDFSGEYTEVVTEKELGYQMGEGGRVVSIFFVPKDGGTQVSETFEMEDENSEEMQRGGWQSILENFKKYTEAN